MDIKYLKAISFNCKSVTRSVEGIRSLCETADIVALQETWLLPHDTAYIGRIHPDFDYCSKSAVDTGEGLLKGRPFGGVAIMWRKSLFTSVSIVQCNSVRLAAIKAIVNNRTFLFFTVYMPCDSSDNLIEFTDCMSEINAIVDSSNIDNVYMLGDFNAHPGELFFKEMIDFCSEQLWDVADCDYLGTNSNTFTFISDINGVHRWLDHCIVTKAAAKSIVNVRVLYDIFWSDHFPLELLLDMGRLTYKVSEHYRKTDRVVWGERQPSQINRYSKICNDKLKCVDFPGEFQSCANHYCSIPEHKLLIDRLYNNIICTLREAAIATYQGTCRKKKYVTGWNKYVKPLHSAARLCFQLWILHGKPRNGIYYENMLKSKKDFKYKLKWCQDNEQKIKMDILASCHESKNFSKFWKETNKLNPRPGVPANVDGESDAGRVADIFKNHFKVISCRSSVSQRFDAGIRDGDKTTCFTAGQVRDVIKNMTRGKSPGHDGISIEHLQHAGFHLPRVLAMLFTFCVGHSYLPADFMKTIVIPILKNRTGDSSDKKNYRPISLATTTAKVMDGLLERKLQESLHLYDAQFGFRPGLSTESAILCLKHAVRYYTKQKTPVIGCFLDLSSAFDMVEYEVLWTKLATETNFSSDLVGLFQYWYNNQQNQVRWAGAFSEAYGLECGVRQGGLSSPALFNLYINSLIGELSSSGVGCYIDNISYNNISYADDMVLLSPSIRGLRKLISICEKYMISHGLRYNVKKSEILVFKCKNRDYNFPPVTLHGVPLKTVTSFKYLGHWITESMSDEVDIERERRALAMRVNMLARRFARCNVEVKQTLFRAYCQSFYTCSLWVEYTQKSLRALRVQYNNGLRTLMGLPRYCSASAMFAEARIDSFQTIMRKRVASVWRRVRDSSNSLLAAVGTRYCCPILRHWNQMHVGSRPAMVNVK